MDFLNMELPDENDKDKFPKLDSWFDFMNEQFKKIEEYQEKNKINNLLIDNDIETI